MARGDWPELALSLASSHAELAARVEHAAKALSVVVGDSERKKVRVLM